MKFLVSLNRAKMLEMARDGVSYDIVELIEDVPTATVLSGNPAVSVQVEVDDRYVNQLKQAVADTCTVGKYGYLEVF